MKISLSPRPLALLLMSLSVSTLGLAHGVKLEELQDSESLRYLTGSWNLYTRKGVSGPESGNLTIQEKRSAPLRAKFCPVRLNIVATALDANSAYRLTLNGVSDSIFGLKDLFVSFDMDNVRPINSPLYVPGPRLLGGRIYKGEGIVKTGGLDDGRRHRPIWSGGRVNPKLVSSFFVVKDANRDLPYPHNLQNHFETHTTLEYVVPDKTLYVNYETYFGNSTDKFECQYVRYIPATVTDQQLYPFGPPTAL